MLSISPCTRIRSMSARSKCCARRCGAAACAGAGWSLRSCPTMRFAAFRAVAASRKPLGSRRRCSVSSAMCCRRPLARGCAPLGTPVVAEGGARPAGGPELELGERASGNSALRTSAMPPSASSRPAKSSEEAGSPRKAMTASPPSEPSWKPAVCSSSMATGWQPTFASNALFASFSRRTTGSSGVCAMRRRMDTRVSTQGRRDSVGRLSSSASRLSRSSSLLTTTSGAAALLVAPAGPSEGGAEGARSCSWSEVRSTTVPTT
mmetsp:Transcript_26441/g.69854  ORF Transcript_26441/g.69854 Transcript_26441/m.69854 type:complete len:263 (+) Transcript_26441:693-1481(+)